MSPRKPKKTDDPVAQSQTQPLLPLAAARLAQVKPPIPTAPAKGLPDSGDFVRGSKWTPVRQTNAYRGSMWIYSPGRCVFLAEASDALIAVAELMGLPNKTLDRVDVVLQLSTKRLFFRPAPEELEEYFDVAETSNEYISINIRSLLQEYDLEVRTGYQERHPVTLDPHSDLGPALVVELDKVEERRRTAISKARQAARAAAKNGGAESTAATVGTTKAAKATAKKIAAKVAEAGAEVAKAAAEVAKASAKKAEVAKAGEGVAIASVAPKKGKSKSATKGSPSPETDDELDELAEDKAFEDE